jgi:hypothetical protein
MEDNLNILANERRPLYFDKWKMTSIIWEMEDNINFFNGRRHQFLKIEDDLDILGSRRRPQYFGRRSQFLFKWKTTSISMPGRQPQFLIRKSWLSKPQHVLSLAHLSPSLLMIINTVLSLIKINLTCVVWQIYELIYLSSLSCPLCSHLPGYCEPG